LFTLSACTGPSFVVIVIVVVIRFFSVFDFVVFWIVTVSFGRIIFIFFVFSACSDRIELIEG